MKLSFSHARRILTEVPRNAKLAYCLLRDPRVPTAPKAALLTALGLIVSPVDLPAWIPVVGELDVLALGILAVKVFIDACPDELQAEHRAALERRESVWDDDRRLLVGTARRQVSRTVGSWRARLPKAG
ncbi:MAG: hypothetical protein E6I70_10085 [Chloroflexi bacterium]|nr:MAG: hypothetical protein E6I63_06275 [Chloroflexota bacterium]TME17593.1 MAG: hypothetical protein E6I70_10085 [Chloroflexota bacterium]